MTALLALLCVLGVGLSLVFVLALCEAAARGDADIEMTMRHED